MKLCCAKSLHIHGIVTGLLSLPQELLQHIAAKLSSEEWARAASACKILDRVPLKSLFVDPATKWTQDSEALAFNVATNLSALKFLGRHSCTAERACTFLHHVNTGVADSAVRDLHWPELKAATIDAVCAGTAACAAWA